MKIDFKGLTLEELKLIHSRRTGKKPAGGWKDALEELALRSQEELKLCGDHIILPLTVRDFARNLFALQGDRLCYRSDPEAPFAPAESMEYAPEGIRCK